MDSIIIGDKTFIDKDRLIEELTKINGFGDKRTSQIIEVIEDVSKEKVEVSKEFENFVNMMNDSEFAEKIKSFAEETNSKLEGFANDPKVKETMKGFETMISKFSDNIFGKKSTKKTDEDITDVEVIDPKKLN